MAFKEAAIPDFVVKKAPLRDAAHKDLKEFIALSIDCAEVDISPFSSLDSAYMTYYSLARNYGYPVAVRRSEGKMYLLRRTQREMTNNDMEVHAHRRKPIDGEGDRYAQTAKRTKPL